MNGPKDAIRPADRALLEQLVKHGDSLETPRHTLVFFYRQTGDTRSAELVFNPMALRLQAFGWEVTDLRADALIAETHRPADADSVNAMAETMEELAAEFGAVFDGWECALVTGEGE
jgi:hypothetical protein